MRHIDFEHIVNSNILMCITYGTNCTRNIYVKHTLHIYIKEATAQSIRTVLITIHMFSINIYNFCLVSYIMSVMKVETDISDIARVVVYMSKRQILAT